MQRASIKQCSQQCDYFTVSQAGQNSMNGRGAGVFYDTILNAACLSSTAHCIASSSLFLPPRLRGKWNAPQKRGRKVFTWLLWVLKKCIQLFFFLSVQAAVPISVIQPVFGEKNGAWGNAPFSCNIFHSILHLNSLWNTVCFIIYVLSISKYVW